MNPDTDFLMGTNVDKTLNMKPFTNCSMGAIQKRREDIFVKTQPDLANIHYLHPSRLIHLMHAKIILKLSRCFLFEQLIVRC